jgi:hypothetical protein
MITWKQEHHRRLSEGWFIEKFEELAEVDELRHYARAALRLRLSGGSGGHGGHCDCDVDPPQAEGVGALSQPAHARFRFSKAFASMTNKTAPRALGWRLDNFVNHAAAR